MYFTKLAYAISEIKPILAEIYEAVANNKLKGFKHSKSLPSAFSENWGISINKLRKKGNDTSIPDLLHEYYHWKSGHTAEGLRNGFKPTIKSINQETEATTKAIDFLKQTKNVRNDKIDYLNSRLDKYKNAL